jgi:putative oxidoreductase
MESLRDVTALVGRILLALIFVWGSLNKIINISGTANYMMEAGIPMNLIYPALYLSIVIELGCGSLVIAGWHARSAALALFLWFIPVTFVTHVAGYFHAIELRQAMAASVQQAMCLKNITIMGGLLVLAAMGPGSLSMDGRGSAAGLNPARRAA